MPATSIFYSQSKAHRSNYLPDIFIWKSNRYLKLAVSKTNSCYCPIKCGLPTTFSILADGNSMLPVTNPKRLSWTLIQCSLTSTSNLERNPLSCTLKMLYKNPTTSCPDWCVSVDWVQACEPKGHQFNCQSRHISELQARPPVGPHETQLQTDVSLPLFRTPFLNLKINK